MIQTQDRIARMRMTCIVLRRNGRCRCLRWSAGSHGDTGKIEVDQNDSILDIRQRICVPGPGWHIDEDFRWCFACKEVVMCAIDTAHVRELGLDDAVQGWRILPKFLPRLCGSH